MSIHKIMSNLLLQTKNDANQTASMDFISIAFLNMGEFVYPY